MENKAFGLNRGVFCGKVVSAPEFNHQAVNPHTNEVVQEYYLFKMEVLFENKKKTVRDESVLPFLIRKDDLENEELGEINVGDLLFVKGKFRAFDRQVDGVRKTVTRISVEKVEKVEELTRTQNKIEFHGYLKGKLFKAEFDENGKLKRENGRLVPVLDDDGKVIPWTRKNKEGLRVNDITLQVHREIVDENGEVKILYKDFVPAIAYGAVAWQIANEIDVKSKVMARGYIRRRPKNGFEGEYVYEAVITRITPVLEEGQKTDTEVETNEEE